MRRLLIWSALAALVGLILAGVGYWAYWNFYSRFQPVTITRDQAEIQKLLDEASWVSGGGGGEPLYIIGYRDSASTQRYVREEVPKMRAAGVEARVILFARADKEGLPQSTPAERAAIAELWLTRDWSLYQRWTGAPAREWTAAGIPAADGNLARSAVVEASRQFDARLTALLKDAGVQVSYPLILWRDREGFLKACGCADSRSWPFIRDDLNAPERVGQPEPVDALPLGEPYPGDGSPAEAGEAALPYPNLPTAPAQPGQTPAPAPNGAAPGTPAAPTAPRAAPEAQKQDETTFY
ncbi:hypothetical protein GVN18_35390 [Pseudomonas sp. ODNR1LW]|nr:hypothetical protein [Pseudomonas sp. ODNR1LW]